MLNQKETVIIRILGKAMEFLAQEEVLKLRNIIEDELYDYELEQKSTDIIPYEGISEKLLLFLTSKKLEGASRHTLKSYSNHLKKFSQFICKKVEDIDAMDIRRYLAAYSQRGVKNSTLDTVISVLKSFFSWLENEDYIIKSPMRKIKPTKKSKRIRKHLTPEELEMLRTSCATQREKAMLELFYSTGCRLDEVYKLNKQDIDWNRGAVNVIGKGDKERTVYLNAKAKVHLWKYLETRIDNNEALFVTERAPHKRLGHRAFQMDFNALGKAAGIIKPVHPHLLRHTMATTAVNNGANIQTVQRMLGHTDPATTQIYAELNNDEIQMNHKRYVS